MFSYLTRISNSKDILLSEALSVSKLLYDQNKLKICYELKNKFKTFVVH